MASSNVTLKLLIDKKGKRVLLAEAGKDFVDFLFSLLALPVGTVIRLLDNRNVEGGLAKLYKSLSDLNIDYIQSDQKKDVLLKPKASLPFVSLQMPLLPTEVLSSSWKHVLCKVSWVFACPSCKRTMSAIDDDDDDDDKDLEVAVDAKGGGFVKGLVTYMVMDDLSVSPMSTISGITLLDKFGISDLGGLEEKVVHVGMNEGLGLLKHSLNSKTVLTDVFLGEVVAKDHNLKKV